MERTLVIEVPGKPIAQKRPRFFRRGKHVGTYNPQATDAGKFMAQLLDAIKFMPGLPISKDIPVQLSCSFYFEIPKSLSKKKRAALDARHVKKPDADNLLKFVADCGVGILWHDDAQVSVCNIEKVYSEKPRTEISVRWQD